MDAAGSPVTRARMWAGLLNGRTPRTLQPNKQIVLQLPGLRFWGPHRGMSGALVAQGRGLGLECTQPWPREYGWDVACRWFGAAAWGCSPPGAGWYHIYGLGSRPCLDLQGRLARNFRRLALPDGTWRCWMAHGVAGWHVALPVGRRLIPRGAVVLMPAWS